MFQLGLSEILFILVIALLLFGAERLPEIGRALGKAIHEFKKGLDTASEEVPREPKKESDQSDGRPAS